MDDLALLTRPIGLELADKLENEIIRESFAPGEKLQELELCARFGVSRSPLREAFQILESRGLVARKPRHGARVTDLSLAALDEISVCRIPLEATCARLLAQLPAARRQQITAALREPLDVMREAERRGDPDAAFDANVALTVLLHAHCGNATLARLLAQLDKAALRYRFRAYRHSGQMISEMIESNDRMIDRIGAGDAEAAAAITAELVERAWIRSRQLFDEAAPEG